MSTGFRQPESVRDLSRGFSEITARKLVVGRHVVIDRTPGGIANPERRQLSPRSLQRQQRAARRVSIDFPQQKRHLEPMAHGTLDAHAVDATLVTSAALPLPAVL